MEFFLIRHGECEPPSRENYSLSLRAANGPLTARGILQAQALAKYLEGAAIDAVYASDLTRAAQTAEVLCEKTRDAPRLCAAFREIDMGEAAYRPWSDFPEEYGRWALHEEDLPYPGGENGAQVWKRFSAALLQIEREGYKRVAIVCHGGVIRCAVCGILGLPQQRRFLLGEPVENCSITIVKHDRETDRYRLQTFNDSAHLAGIPL
ncbi:MAG: histidine phosphatase family protein [Clostridiaceae bacterium]|nr:histidine phosphatase family protein [Eubacteriales bacterium]